MKLLALADIHGKDISYMVQEISGMYDFSLILIAGDISNFGPGEVAVEILNSIPGKIMAVPGNCDPPEIIEAIEKSKAINLHLKERQYMGYKFIGLGGVNGGFNMGIKFTDTLARDFLGNCRGCIFLTHQPPFGILDNVGETHIGSKGIREAVDIAKPILVVSGHVHEARGYEKIRKTLFVNPGPAKDGYASIIDLTAMEVKMLEI